MGVCLGLEKELRLGRIKGAVDVRAWRFGGLEA